jgi:hypothetical protein
VHGEKGKKMADKLISADALLKRICELCGENCEMPNEAVTCIEWEFAHDAIESLPPVDAEPKWIPITSRPMDDEERIEWSEKLGYDIANDDGEALIYTSQLPDDGQEVLVCGYGRVWIDTFKSDPDYGCYFEENGEMDGIVAWMPLPKPYGERREDER